MSSGVELNGVTHADSFGDEGALSPTASYEARPLEQRLEALLLAADRPLSDSRLVELLGLLASAIPQTKPRRKKGPASDGGELTDAGEQDPASCEDSATAKARRAAVTRLQESISQLNEFYGRTERAFRIESVAGGWQMLTLAEFGPMLAKLRGERLQTRLSQPALETLAIVAYRQPILRADLESIRGVACGEVLKSLMDRRLVRIVGRAEEVGRPMLYGTTKEFLRIFGIASIGDLPDVASEPKAESPGASRRPSRSAPSSDISSAEPT